MTFSFLSLSTEQVVFFVCVTCPCSFWTKRHVNLFVNNNNNNNNNASDYRVNRLTDYRKTSNKRPRRQKLVVPVFNRSFTVTNGLLTPT